MSQRLTGKWIWFAPLLLVLVVAITWHVALAQAPTPNPLPNPAVPNLLAPGPAATIHGNPLAGQAVFAGNCASCHGDRGAMGEDNPGSDDGTVPGLNPIDPGFLADSNGDPGIFAKDLDLFIQHGSRPSGPSPSMLMPAWGDKKLLTQQQIADAEAYVMQLNGVWWPDQWYPPAEVRMTATRDGQVVTYTVTIVNHGGSDLTDILVRDTLPAGLALIKSGFPGVDSNPGQVGGSTVQWVAGPVPRGGALGPFVMVTGLSGTTVPPNVAQVIFTFCTWNNNCLLASNVSGQVVPGTPANLPTTGNPANLPTTGLPTTGQPSGTAMETPRPSGGNTTAGPAITQNLTGNAASGAQVYASNCASCHGDQGKGGVANPGSTDGTVPPLNPIDPGLKSADPKTFAFNIDLFIEHGSTPAGPSPTMSMLPFGDKGLLTPQQIADVIAYVISLNP